MFKDSALSLVAATCILNLSLIFPVPVNAQIPVQPAATATGGTPSSGGTTNTGSGTSSSAANASAASGDATSSGSCDASGGMKAFGSSDICSNDTTETDQDSGAKKTTRTSSCDAACDSRHDAQNFCNNLEDPSNQPSGSNGTKTEAAAPYTKICLNGHVTTCRSVTQNSVKGCDSDSQNSCKEAYSDYKKAVQECGPDCEKQGQLCESDKSAPTKTKDMEKKGYCKTKDRDIKRQIEALKEKVKQDGEDVAKAQAEQRKSQQDAQTQITAIAKQLNDATVALAQNNTARQAELQQNQNNTDTKTNGLQKDYTALQNQMLDLKTTLVAQAKNDALTDQQRVQTSCWSDALKAANTYVQQAQRGNGGLLGEPPIAISVSQLISNASKGGTQAQLDAYSNLYYSKCISRSDSQIAIQQAQQKLTTNLVALQSKLTGLSKQATNIQTEVGQAINSLGTQQSVTAQKYQQQAQMINNQITQLNQAKMQAMNAQQQIQADQQNLQRLQVTQQEDQSRLATLQQLPQAPTTDATSGQDDDAFSPKKYSSLQGTRANMKDVCCTEAGASKYPGLVSNSVCSKSKTKKGSTTTK